MHNRVEDVEASIEGPTRLVVRLGAQSDGGSCGLYRRLYSTRHSIVYTIAFGTVLNRCIGLEGAHSFVPFWSQISSFSRYFLKTLTETGSIHWVGVSYIFGKLMTNGMQWWVVHDILGSLGGH